MDDGGNLLTSANMKKEANDMVGRFWKDVESEFGKEQEDA